MKKEYKVTRHVANTTEEEKEEVYKQLANIFVRMALKERENERKWRKMTKEQKIYCIIGRAISLLAGCSAVAGVILATLYYALFC